MTDQPKNLPGNNGMEIKNWFCNDIRFTHAKTQYQQPGFHNAHSEADVVHLHFGLKGDYRVTYQQIDKSFDLPGGHHNMFYSRQFDMEFYNKTLNIETLGIQFPKDMFIRFTENASDDLKRFSEQILRGENIIFSDHWAPINLPIQQVIQQIIQQPFTNGLQEMFLLAKSLELIVLSTDAYLSDKKRSEAIIKRTADKEKIIAARDIINEQLKTPPNLSQVSKMVGLNEYKLKHGFKEMFNTTLFNYLTEQRLSLSLKYLKDTQLSVAEIAFEMGYATPQHFNNAFRKKFGITPNSVRKNP